MTSTISRSLRFFSPEQFQVPRTLVGRSNGVDRSGAEVDIKLDSVGIHDVHCAIDIVDDCIYITPIEKARYPPIRSHCVALHCTRYVQYMYRYCARTVLVLVQYVHYLLQHIFTSLYFFIGLY